MAERATTKVTQPPAGSDWENVNDWETVDAAAPKTQPQSPPQNDQRGFWGNFIGRPSDLVDSVKGIGHAVAHPLDTLSSMGQQTIDLAKETGQAFGRGDVLGGIRRGLNTGINAVVPGLGAASEDAGKDLEAGRYGSGLGKTAALGVETAAGIKAPNVARAGNGAVKGFARAIEEAPNSKVGGTIGGFMGYKMGGYPGAAMGTAIGVKAPAIPGALSRAANAAKLGWEGKPLPSAAPELPTGSPTPFSKASVSPVESPIAGPRIQQHLGDMRIKGRTPPFAVMDPSRPGWYTTDGGASWNPPASAR